MMLAFVGAAKAAEPLPPILREVGIDQKLNAQVPVDQDFRDEAGQSIRLGDCFGGKPVILVLAYYRCPMLCTQVLNGLLEGLRGVPFDAGKQFNVVAVSFDPREMPALAAAKKATYVEQYGRHNAAAGWHFLTGDQAGIDRLTEAAGFHYRYDPQQDQFAHASGIMILTPQGRIARYFYGIDFPSRDLRLGLVEASENKIGAPVDQLLLFCYHYDAATGTYTAQAMNLVRLGGVLTLLVLGTLLFGAWYRELRKGRRRTAPDAALSG
jgi:protein SCO1/2